jgi:hypothetical protein
LSYSNKITAFGIKEVKINRNPASNSAWTPDELNSHATNHGKINSTRPDHGLSFSIKLECREKESIIDQTKEFIKGDGTAIGSSYRRNGNLQKMEVVDLCIRKRKPSSNVQRNQHVLTAFARFSSSFVNATNQFSDAQNEIT